MGENNPRARSASHPDIGIGGFDGPFTTHPMTATFTGLSTVASRCSTSCASPMRFTWQRPQVGQLMSSGLRRRKSSAPSSVQQARTSTTGSSVSEMRIVSPIPSSKRTPRPHALLMMPWKAVPASVTPMCSGTSGSSAASRR